MTASAPQSGLFARDKLPQWGVLLLMILLIIGILLFIILVLLPDVRRRSEYSTVLTSARTELRVAEQAKSEAPAKLQTQLVEAEARLNEAAQAFLNEAEATVLVNRLYTYAQDASVEIVNLQAAPAILADTHSQRDYRFQVAGRSEFLLAFLGRIREVDLPGFVINNVSLVPDQNSPAGEKRHLLTMNVSVVTSPFSTSTVLGPTESPDIFANVGDLPLAEIQRQLELAWNAREWQQAIDLLEQVVATSPENASARIALYRAHVNFGYYYLNERNDAAAKLEFEAALTVLANGREATAELQQIAVDSTLSYSVEERLRQELEQAKATGHWQEVIRLLRIIAAVDPAYGPVGDQLTQAYLNYGNLLAVAGDAVRAEEQYQLAQYPSPNQPQPTGAVAIAIAQSLTGTVLPVGSPVAVAPAETPVAPPTLTPLPLPTEIPTAVPTAIPTETPTMQPTSSPTPTQTPVPTATATQPPPPVATATATSTSVPASPTTVPTSAAAPTTTGAIITPTVTATTAPSLATQVQPPTATYVVQAGDTLFSIAQRFGTTVAALQAANGLAGDTIRAGQVLFITPSTASLPAPGLVVHTVAPNDTLFSLSQRYGTTVEAIMQANGLATNRIIVGQQLNIPVPISVVPLATTIGS